jgi:transcription elongation factor S-II
MDELRSTCKKKLKKIIGKSKLASKVEKGIYKVCKNKGDTEEITRLYQDKARSILCNLDPDSYIGNKKLLDKIKSKEIKAKKLAKLKPEELFPERWVDDIENMKKIEDRTYKYREDICGATDIYKCKKCYQRKTTSYQAQTRCADEGMTTFVFCLMCGNQWRF